MEAPLSNGKVEHAVGVARSRESREQLARAGHDIMTARGRMRRLSPQEAIEIWRALVAGRWSVVDHFDTEGRRYLIARRNEPEPAPSAGLASLTPRELEIVAYAALGHTNKLIAYELGLAPTTVATHLASAAAKLGVSTRIDLVRAFVDARRNSGAS